MAAGKLITPVKVGVFVVLAGIAFAVFLQIVSTRGVSKGGGYRVFAIFDDVLGLEKKSPVQIAGIDVGRIDDIRLEGGKARVELIIDKGVKLYDNAMIEKVSISL